MTVTERWVAIDFETANRQRGSACALGLTVLDGLEVVEERSWLIDPASEFDAFNIRLHGIDEDAVDTAPEFDGVWTEVLPLLDHSVLLAHNAAFDMGVLRAALDRYELDPPDLDYACTVELSRKTWPHLHNHRLDTVCACRGIELDHHDAGSDASGCARIALACCEYVGARDVGELLERLGVGLRRL